MQATSIELLAMLTVLEMLLRRVLGSDGVLGEAVGRADAVPAEMRAALEELHAQLTSPATLPPLARLVETEERIYRAGGRTSYFADALGIDVLTDTTERSPTFCTPAFRQWDDAEASESWAFLFTPAETTDAAWPGLLRRAPHTVEWTERELRSLLDEEAAARQTAVVRDIGYRDLMRFRIGLDGMADRPFRKGDAGVVVTSGADLRLLASADAAFTRQIDAASAAGAETVLVAVGRRGEVDRLVSSAGGRLAGQAVALTLSDTPFLIDPMARVGAKLLLNALSTCTMVRLGRVLGNRMIWVVPSNLKLIDRSARYIRDLTGVSYEGACHALFEVIEYVEPRRRAGKAYPPPVGLAVMRLRHGIDFGQAEARLAQELSL
jgi:N-acetylmuramic acid 6-phosphate etherase